MILEMYCIHDKGINAYAQPFFCRARGEALRNFIEACADTKSPLHNYPLDYSLCHIGKWDDATGIVLNNEHGPVRELGATEAVAQLEQKRQA